MKHKLWPRSVMALQMIRNRGGLLDALVALHRPQERGVSREPAPGFTSSTQQSSASRAHGANCASWSDVLGHACLPALVASLVCTAEEPSRRPPPSPRPQTPPPAPRSPTPATPTAPGTTPCQTSHPLHPGTPQPRTASGFPSQTSSRTSLPSPAPRIRRPLYNLDL